MPWSFTIDQGFYFCLKNGKVETLLILKFNSMGWFSSDKSISHFNLDKLLKEILILQPTEREYVKGLFTKYQAGGVSKFEVEKAVREMKFNTSDIIDPAEADAIREKLLSYLN